MTFVKQATLAFLAASAAFAPAGAAKAADRRPIVVELFTSQGCSSCPPANANLIALSQRPDVLALSFSVTYWDRLGWKDIFGKTEFTRRQYAYEPALGQAGPFTPQIVVDGRSTVVGNDLRAIETLLAAEQKSDAGPSVRLDRDRVSIGAGKALAEADVWLVRYEPNVINVAVKRGENGDRTLPHGHVVRTLTRLGGWTGDQAVYPLTAAAGLRTAILVQTRNGGPILAAATD